MDNSPYRNVRLLGLLFAKEPPGKKKRKKKNRRRKLLEQDPHCHFCGREVNFDDSGVFKLAAQKEKVLACLECIYKHRREQYEGGRSTRRRKRLLEQDPRCYYCQCDVTLENSTLDHLVPRAKKGKNTVDNIVLSCYTCNHRKGTKTAAEFLAILEAERERKQAS
jgi:hypothetical protein